MKIGIITGEYPPLQGGVGDYTRAFAQALAEQGNQVSILTGRNAAPDAVPAASAQVPLGVQVSPLIKRWDLGSMRTVLRWARAGTFDLINLQFETAAYQMSPWVHFYPLMLRPIPVVTTFHDLKVPYLLPKAGPLRAAIVTFLAQTSRLAITTNAADATALGKRGIAAIRVLPIGSNIPTRRLIDFDPTAWRVGITPNPSAAIIGYFGFMNASKGVDTLIEATRMLQEQAQDVHLLLIGGRTGSSDPENAAYAAQIEALITRLELQERVHWTGFIDAPSVSAYLTSCDLIALPFVDGATLRRGSLMAALAHGAAIVTTPALPREPVLEGVVAYTPVSDAPLLASTMSRLLSSAAERQALRDKALVASRQFEWSSIAQKFVQFVTPLIDR